MTCTLSRIWSLKLGALGSVARVQRNGLSRSRVLLITEAGGGGSVFSDLQPETSNTTPSESTMAAEIGRSLKGILSGPFGFPTEFDFGLGRSVGALRLRRSGDLGAMFVRDGEDAAVGQLAD